MLDEVSADEVLSAGFDDKATEAARRTVESFRAFVEEHRDEITALQIIYSIPQDVSATQTFRTGDQGGRPYVDVR